MTARSVVLSVLLGAHPAWATASELIRLTADFDIREPTVAGGADPDGQRGRPGALRRTATGSPIGCWPGSAARTTRSTPRLRKWHGTWTTLVITSVGIDARTRAALRTTLQDKRFGELREGVWLRPDNLDVELTAEVLDRVRVLHARDDDPAELAARLWDLPGWVRIGRELLDEMATATDVPGRFVAAAGMVRHLLTDPVLPDELLPDDWPGDALRAAYMNFAAELVARRDGVELMEATVTEWWSAGRAQRRGDDGDHGSARGAQRRQRARGGGVVRGVRRVRQR